MTKNKHCFRLLIHTTKIIQSVLLFDQKNKHCFHLLAHTEKFYTLLSSMNKK